MYIQITTRTKLDDDGEDMLLSKFKEAVIKTDGSIIIVGGDPILHPRFEEFLVIALGQPHCFAVEVRTYGTIKEKALYLAQMAKKGILWATLLKKPNTPDCLIDAFHKRNSYKNDCGIIEQEIDGTTNSNYRGMFVDVNGNIIVDKIRIWPLDK